MYLFCCLSKNKNGVVDVHDDIKKEPEEVSSNTSSPANDEGGGEKAVGVTEKNTNEVKTDPIDKCVRCRQNFWKSQSELISEDAQRSSLSTNVETTSPSSHTVTPMYPVKLFLSEEETEEAGCVEDECQAAQEVRRPNKSCDNVVVLLSNVFRRMLPKWATIESGRTDFGSSVDDKRRRKLFRQGFQRRGRGKTRKNETDNSFDELKVLTECPEFSEIPLTSAEPSLLVKCQEKPNTYQEKSDCPENLGDLKRGQGDAFRLPGYVMYGPHCPGKHLLQPQVLPVFSWSVPVFRTRLAEGGVSFTFGSDSGQPGSSGTGTPSGAPRTTTTQVPTQLLVSTTGTYSNPTPMEVDEPTPPDGSLLNRLVQLTNPSPIDNQQMMQQLREDMQKQLDLQLQHQQQLIQQEMEARMRQMGAAACETGPPDHVMFCEWTLVLRYPSNQKVADRPMGELGHEPLRNYELKRRSSDSQNIPDPQGSDSQDPSTEPEPRTEPVPVCPQGDPVKTEPAPVCPDPAAPATSTGSSSEPGIPEQPANPEPEPVKSESVPETPLSEPVKSEPENPKPDSESASLDPVPTSSGLDSEAVNPKPEPVKSEPEPADPVVGSETENRSIKSEPPERVKPKPRSPEKVACVKKPKPKKRKIRHEKLDDDYDVF